MKRCANTIFLFLITCAVTLSSCENKRNVIFTSNQLIALLNSLIYENEDAQDLPISDDIQIIGTVTISSEQLAIPAECDNKNEEKYHEINCRHIVGFENKYPASGIIVHPLSYEYYPPAKITLTNVKLRFRPIYISFYLVAGYDLIPVIQILSPSDYECSGTDIKCSRDGLCYDNDRGYCYRCLLMTQEECACRDEKGVYPDGAECWLYYGGDVLQSGTCKNGNCEGIN